MLDFKSLYPSIIRNFGIDPYALHVPCEDRIEGFQGASFVRDGAILPGRAPTQARRLARKLLRRK